MGIGCRPETGTLPTAPTDKDMLHQARLKATSVAETQELYKNDEPQAERLKYQLNRLAVMGMRLNQRNPYDVLDASPEIQQAYLDGAADGARFVISFTRSGGIA